jgi:phage terminase small subunit
MDWNEIKKEYETTDITLKALAEKHDIKIGTLKSRKSREGWDRNVTKKDATLPKKVVTSKTERNEHIEALVESEELTEKQRLFLLVLRFT